MDAATFQVSARDAAQIVHMAALERLTQVAMNIDLDPDLALKILRETKDIAQAVPKDKVDQYANLQVWNIVMHNGRMGGGVSAQPVLEMAEEVNADTFNLSAAVPTQAMLVAANINTDVIDMTVDEVERLLTTSSTDDIFNNLDGSLGIDP